MKNSLLLMPIACLTLAGNIVCCGSSPSGSVPKPGADSSPAAGAGTHASTATAPEPDGAYPADANAPTLFGVYFQDSNIIYVSNDQLSCDGNAVSGGKTVARLWMNSIDANGDYNVIVGDAYTSPDKGLGREFTLAGAVFDDHCQQTTSQNTNTVGIGALPYFNGVQIWKIDDAKKTLSLNLENKTSQKTTAYLHPVICPSNSADPFVPDYNDHCAIPRDCQPIAAVCR